MDDFKKQGGALTGREERHDKFDGCPPEQIAGHNGGHSDHSHGSTTSSALPTTGSHSTNDTSRAAPSTITDNNSSSGGPFNSHKHDPGMQSSTSSSHQHPTPASYGNDMHPEKTSGTSTGKPSLMDKLNPKVDANGDGQPGFMK